MAEIFLSIGSNVEPESNFKRCALALSQQFNNSVWSPVYRSPAIGMTGADFYNAVVAANTEQSIESVDQTLKSIEEQQGRVRTENKFSSRTLDIDLLLYSEVVSDAPELVLPRPEITTAAHVLVPLTDLAPERIHPRLAKSYSTLLDELNNDQPDLANALEVVTLELPTQSSN